MTQEEVIEYLESLTNGGTRREVDMAFYDFVSQYPELSAEALYVYIRWENDIPMTARPWEVMKDYW